MSEEKVKVLRPKASRLELGLGEIWEYRELLYFLTLKQIKTKYKQTAIGIGWAVLQPLITALIFAALLYSGSDPPFKPQSDINALAFLFAGLMLWTFFSTALNGASMSLVTNTAMITKIYFPRILLPLSLCIAGLLDYALAFVLFLVIVVATGTVLSIGMIFILVPLTLAFLLGCGLSFWMSAMSAKYRDVQYIVPFLISILLFITPILYPPGVISSQTWILYVNPLSGIMQAQRFFIFGTPAMDWLMLGSAAIITMAIFFFGILYFKAYERQLADVI
jgi:homopolymeric O-antigen transport system permease protein